MNKKGEVCGISIYKAGAGYYCMYVAQYIFPVIYYIREPPHEYLQKNRL